MCLEESDKSLRVDFVEFEEDLLFDEGFMDFIELR